MPLVRCFLPSTLSQWCRNAMKWVAEILEDQSERKFKRTYLYKLMQGPPMEDPEGEDGSDLIESLLRERPKQQNINDGEPGDGGMPPGGGQPGDGEMRNPEDDDDDDGGGHSSHSSWHSLQKSSDKSSSSDDSSSSKETKESELYDDLSELAEDDDVPWVGRDIEVDTSQRIIQIFQGTWRLNNEVYYTVKDLLLQQGDNCTVTDQVLDDLKRQMKMFREAYRNIMAAFGDDDETISL